MAVLATIIVPEVVACYLGQNTGTDQDPNVIPDSDLENRLLVMD